MSGVAMNVPRNVLWFEVLLYVSLILDALSRAFAERTPGPQMTESMIMVKSLTEACLILLFAYFVWLAARRRKNWPRWALTAALVLSAISVVQVIGQTGLQFDTGVATLSCALSAAGLYLSFTGDAVGWFNA
jgi:low temperature requirement protein LtrA